MCTVICHYSSCPSIGNQWERRISNEFQVSKLFSLTVNLPTNLKILNIFWSHLFISFLTHITITIRYSSLNGNIHLFNGPSELWLVLIMWLQLIGWKILHLFSWPTNTVKCDLPGWLFPRFTPAFCRHWFAFSLANLKFCICVVIGVHVSRVNGQIEVSCFPS